MLPASIKNAKEFLDLFSPPEIEGHKLTKKTKISLFVLRMEGGGFDYESMYRELGNAAIAYVFSRVKLEEMVPGREHEYFKLTQESFRSSPINEGEGGELLLYCFLETHLKAPKILSKMELKTSANDYVKGADGIHLLDVGNGVFQLIYGESKMLGDSKEMDSSFRKAMASAFKSINAMNDAIKTEIRLVDSNLMKESHSPEMLNFLRKIIKPSGRDESLKSSKAFGIFVGFEVDLDHLDLQEMEDFQIQEYVKSKAKSLVEDRYGYIKTQIKENNLSGYHFYVYAVPFIKSGEIGIDSTRREIINRI
jgi:hypothetical protein